jgi:hypothetical protein
VGPQEPRGADLSLGIGKRVVRIHEPLKPAREPGAGTGQHDVGPVKGVRSKTADPSELPLSTYTARHPAIEPLGRVAGEDGGWLVVGMAGGC